MKTFLTFLFLLCFIGSKASKIYPVYFASKLDTAKSNHHKRKIPRVRVVDRYIPTPDDDCVFINKLSLREHLSRYPFSKAAKLVAVSYKYAVRQPDILVDDTIPKPADSIFLSDLHVEDGRLNYSSLIEIKNLSTKQITELTNIIYNTDYKHNHKRNGVIPGYTCYSPRNAILFFDKTGKICDYLEICFECQKTTSLSEMITIGTNCTQKLDLMRNFLISAGIKYGITKTD